MIDSAPVAGESVRLGASGRAIFGEGRKTTTRSSFQKMAASAEFWVVFLAPSCLFFTTLMLWTYGFMIIPIVCISFSAIALFGCLLCIGGRKAKGSRGKTFLFIGLLGLPAVGFGSLCGLYVYDQYAIFPGFYRNTRKYTDVAPSSSSAAVADGGQLVFTSDSVIDKGKSASFTAENGVLYCAAPILNGGSDARVEFWAVGIGCCSPGSNSGFECDQSGDTDAHAGIRVFENNGYFAASRFDNYEKAAAKASATYGIQTVMDPIFVRWVKENNLNMLHDSYMAWSVVCVVGLTLVALGLFFMAADMLSAYLVAADDPEATPKQLTPVAG